MCRMVEDKKILDGTSCPQTNSKLRKADMLNKLKGSQTLLCCEIEDGKSMKIQVGRVPRVGEQVPSAGSECVRISCEVPKLCCAVRQRTTNL